MKHGNVNFDPLTQAEAVESPEIDEVLDLKTGEFVDAPEFIKNHLYGDLIKTRKAILSQIKTDKAQYVCALCNTPVYLVSTSEKRFFFRHKVEDGSCAAKTRSSLSEREIRAIKYHGLRESEAHIHIKELLANSLEVDSDFTEVKVETTWRGTVDPKKYRRPDVQAQSSFGSIAFEVQLSTTFLSVVVERSLFYEKEGGILVWVMGGFEESYRRLTTDDLLFNNNSNIFVVDEETAKLSKSDGKFQIRCHYRRPVIVDNQIADDWHDEIVSFDQLTFDRVDQRIFLYDYDTEFQSLQVELKERKLIAAAERQREVKEAAEVKLNQVRQQLFHFWKAKGNYADPDDEMASENWAYIRGDFLQYGIHLPEFPDGDRETRGMLNALFSAQAGKPIGSNFNQLLQVAHNIADSYPRQLLTFGYAIAEQERVELLESQDKKGKWKTKIKELSLKIGQYSPEYRPDQSLLPLLRFLSPSVAARVENYLVRADGVRSNNI